MAALDPVVEPPQALDPLPYGHPANAQAVGQSLPGQQGRSGPHGRQDFQVPFIGFELGVNHGYESYG